MFINKGEGQRNNICGIKIAEVRKSMRLSQRQLAEKLQLEGLVIDKNAVQRIEAGLRFVIDTELEVFAKVLGITIPELLGVDDKK